MENQDTPKGRSHRRVLVVDDDEALCGLVAKRLNRLGFNVSTAGTGNKAIEVVSTTPGLILLLDQQLPDMTGSQIITVLGERGLLTPFIVMTGQGDERLAVQMMKLGAADYLVKDTDFLDRLPGILERMFKNLDIEQRLHSTEVALHKSEESYRFLVESAPIGIFRGVLGGENLTLSVNSTLAHMLGYNSAEEAVQGLNNPDYQLYVHLERRDEFLRELRARGRVANFDYEANTADGRRVWLSMNARVAHIDGRNDSIIDGFVSDITERKRAEDALHRSETQLSNALSIARLGHWELDVASGIFTFSDNFYSIFHTTAEEVGGYQMSIAEYARRFVHPQDAPRVGEETRWAIEADDPNFTRYLEHRMLYADGGVGHMAVRFFIVKDNQGKTIKTYGINQDITERKGMELALEKRVIALTRPLAQNAAIDFDELFDRASIQKLQDEFAAATGIASIITRPDGTPITQPSNFTFLCSEIIRKTPRGLANCFKSDAILGAPHPGGPIIKPCLSGGLWDAGASINVGGYHIANWLIGQVRDETQTEESLREYAYAIGADETTVREAFSKVPSMSHERFGQVARALYTLANQLSTTAYQNVQQARFISERKQAENALRESETKFRAIFESSLDAIGVLKTGIHVFANPAYLKLFGYGLEEELIGKPVVDLIVPDEREKIIQNVQRGAIGESVPMYYETRGLRKDGTQLEMDVNVSTYKLNNETYTLVILRDITERKQAEAQLKKTLAEKEALLRELYHRTKNNMAVIDAMLILQAEYFNDERLRLAFEDARNRIRSMALVHQKLYEAQDLSHINLKDYITDLVRLMLGSYALSSEYVSFVSEMEDVSVLIDMAVPCGLIVNELISNTLKYAFPGERPGKIIIRLRRLESKEIRLEVSDDGVGLPFGFDARRNGCMGLQTLFALAEGQLRARVDFSSADGVHCALQFRDDLYEVRV